MTVPSGRSTKLSEFKSKLVGDSDDEPRGSSSTASNYCCFALTVSFQQTSTRVPASSEKNNVDTTNDGKETHEDASRKQPLRLAAEAV